VKLESRRQEAQENHLMRHKIMKSHLVKIENQIKSYLTKCHAYSIPSWGLVPELLVVERFKNFVLNVVLKGQ
jgi:hypothetical protein